MRRPRPIAIALLGLILTLGCDRAADVGPTPGTVASASPAATDVLLRLGAGDKLVAVSRYDAAAEVAGLPRVGDANGIDWEVVAKVRPASLAVGVSPSRLPAGDRERAASFGVELLDVQVVRLSDIAIAVRKLAEAIGRDPADAEAAFWRDVGPAVDIDNERPRVLVVLDADLSFVAGRRNYVDDLIAHAGGDNAVPADLADWPTLDREALLSLDPDAVVLVLPGANAGVLAAAEAAWHGLPPGAMPAWEEVVVATEPYAMTPGWSGVEALANKLRGAIDRSAQD